MRILILTWRDLHHPLAGGAEVYTEQVAKRWAAKGHQITLFSAAVADRPVVEKVDGYTVVRGGNRYTVYRKARTWWKRVGRYQGFDLVIDMVEDASEGLVVALRERLAAIDWDKASIAAA